MGTHTRTSGFPTAASIDLDDLLGIPPDRKTENAAPDGPRNGAITSGKEVYNTSHYIADNIDLLALSALDRPLNLARFSNVKARTIQAESVSLRELAELIPATRETEKKRPPLLKLATFGDQRTDSGSLRHDRNIVAISGIEGDYDCGEVTPDDAANRLREAGGAALIYSKDEDGDAIPLPRCNPLDVTDLFEVKLTTAERAALEILRGDVATKEDSDGLILSTKDEWRELCRAEKRVCTGDKRNSQNVAFNRVLKGLCNKGLVTVVTDPVTGADLVKHLY